MHSCAQNTPALQANLPVVHSAETRGFIQLFWGSGKGMEWMGEHNGNVKDEETRRIRNECGKKRE